MYLERLRLEHVRLFEEDEISFVDAAGAPRMFTVILAENGFAKTTLLQAIALAASGVGGANKLASNAASFFDKRWTPPPEAIGKSEDYCWIFAEFRPSTRCHLRREYPSLPAPLAHPPLLRSNLFAPFEWKQFQGSSGYSLDASKQPPMESIRAKDLPYWFVAGYGASRTLPVPQPPTEPGNRSIDRLQSLFRPSPLIATGFMDVLERQFGDDIASDYARTLRDVLVGAEELPGILPRHGALRVEDVELRDSGGARGSGDLVEAERFLLRFGDAEEVKIPAVWLSAGYQSTIAWIADLIGQVALDAGAVVPPAEMEGLVLIDEIDLHLHPRWQTSLVPALRKTFPRLQFIATTHSPMILPGLAPHEVLLLRADSRGSVRAEFPEDDPRMLTAAQLYREFFGVQDLFPTPVGNRLRRFGLLAGIAERTDTEEAELHALLGALRSDGIDPGPFERRRALKAEPEQEPG
jgi:hypothetical protein